MFEKRYLFETTDTRRHRILKKFFAMIIFLAVSYVVGAMFIIMDANKLTEQTVKSKIFPDLIVVFTGGKGRISKGIEMARGYDQKNIFISGVYSKNTVKTILESNDLESFEGHNLEIDYAAQNTVENVLSTFSYLNDNSHFENIIIISSDYHLPRIKMIFDFLKEDSNFNLYYRGIDTNFKNITNMKILLLEVYKYIRTFVFLIIWPNDKFF